MVYLSLSYLEHVSLFFFYRIIVTILTCYNLYISLFISAIISTTQLEAVQWLHSDWRACNEIITEEDPAPCSWEYAKVNANSGGGHATSMLLNFDLVPPCLRDVPYPSIGMITCLIIDTQKSHVNARCREHGNLKLHIDRWPGPCLWTYSPHQFQICRQHTFCLSRESLDPPYDGVLLRLILCTAEWIFDFWFGSILWDRYFNDNVGSKQLFWEVCNDF